MIKEVYILDTRAISTGLTIPTVEMYTTSSVIREAKRGRYWDDIKELRLKTSKVIVLDPERQWLEKARSFMERTGDLRAISDTDLSIIALALQLSEERARKVVVLSDDYSLMNVCKVAGIEVKSILFQGISEAKTWEWYCPACGHRPGAREDSKSCPICGATLKRRPKATFGR